MDGKQLLERLNAIFESVTITEIAISPYPILDCLPHHSPFALFEQSKIVIPQKPLYVAFAAAINQFHADQTADDNTVLQITRTILLQVPEHATALNRRKQIIKRHPELSQPELQFTELVLRIPQIAKSALLWHHRRWLLAQLYSPSQKELALPNDIASKEFKLALHCAVIYKRNHSAWAHRSAIMRAVQTPQLLEEDTNRIMRHLDTNVADHSASYYLYLVADTLQNSSLNVKIRQHAEEAVIRYGDRETSWLHLRQAVHLAEDRNLEEGIDLAKTQMMRAVASKDSKTALHASNTVIWLTSELQGKPIPNPRLLLNPLA